MPRIINVTISLVALALPLDAALAQSNEVTFRVTGVFDSYSDLPGIPLGAPFVVEYTYDANAEPLSFRPEVYVNPGAVTRIDVDSGSLYLEQAPANMTVIVNNDLVTGWCGEFDNYDINAREGGLTDGTASYVLEELEFQTYSCSVPGVLVGAGGALPTTAPDLTSADQKFLRVCVADPNACDPEEDWHCDGNRPLCSQGAIQSWVVCGDEDSDGVNDCYDQCAGSAAGSSVDANGCNAAQVVCGCAQSAPGQGSLQSEIVRCTIALWGQLPQHAYQNAGELVASFASGAATCP